MSQKPHFFLEFWPIVGIFILALASCGGSGSATKPDAAALKDTGVPDAQVIIVYVTPDAAPPAATTCACVCADPCTCNCDCGTGQPIAVLMPGCIPTINNDAHDAPIAPIVVDAATLDTLAVPKDANVLPNDVAVADVSIAHEAGKSDVPTVPDIPAFIVEPQRSDAAAPDASAIADADRGDVPAVTTADSAPDKGPDLPPPDTRPPCTTPICQCAATDANVSAQSLMSISNTTDPNQLPAADYIGIQDGFGVYYPDPTNTWRIATIQASSPIAGEVDVNYNLQKRGFESLSCDCPVEYADWFTLRSQFNADTNLCGATGISFDYKGSMSSPRPEATLRVTLADTICQGAGAHDRSDAGVLDDELWWYDIPQSQVTTDWQTIHVPFGSFRIDYNDRLNDHILDPHCIIAFEINYQYDVTLNCANGCITNDIVSGSGNFAIRNLITY
jgi:hypothetical protein